MKKICLYLTTLALTVFVVSCSEEKLDPNSVIKDPLLTENALDSWLMENYVLPYNIDLVYRQVDNDLPMFYNLIPADFEKSAQLAQVFKHLSIVPYDSVTGSSEFVRYAFPKFLNFVGSGAHNNNGTVILGTAEDGIKVVMYQVNEWYPEVSAIDANRDFYPMHPNGIRYFHTLHHELKHILNQRRPFPPLFRTIGQGTHTQDDWSTAFANTPDGLRDARRAGFITQYASKDPNEDIAELFSVFISATPEYWASAMEQGVIRNTGGAITDSTGREAMLSKHAIMSDYMLKEWGININELRRIILKHYSELPTMNLNLD